MDVIFVKTESSFIPPYLQEEPVSKNNDLFFFYLTSSFIPPANDLPQSPNNPKNNSRPLRQNSENDSRSVIVYDPRFSQVYSTSRNLDHVLK